MRKEHDAQIVQIAMEAGLHISPEQWSALLYGDDEHKSHMQSIIDKVHTLDSFVYLVDLLIRIFDWERGGGKSLFEKAYMISVKTIGFLLEISMKMYEISQQWYTQNIRIHSTDW